MNYGRGLFGSQNNHGLPKKPIGTGVQQAPIPNQPTPVGDKAFLDTTKGKFAALGDLLLRASGRGGNPMLQYGMQQDFLRQRDQQSQQAAALRLQNQQSLHDYKLQNAAPPKPGSFEWYQTADPQSRAVYDQYNPVTTNTAYGTTVVPRGSMGGGGPPPAAVEHLRGNPSLSEAFDQKYGAGAASRALGR